MKSCKIGILGATGAVGCEMRKVLEEYDIPVSELRLPSGVTLGGYVRGDNQGALVYGNTQLQPGDRVVVFCKSGLIKMMDRYFSKKSGGLHLF